MTIQTAMLTGYELSPTTLGFLALGQRPKWGIKRGRSRCLRLPASGRFSPSANVAYRVLNRHSRPVQPGGRATLQPDFAEWLRCADCVEEVGGGRILAALAALCCCG